MIVSKFRRPIVLLGHNESLSLYLSDSFTVAFENVVHIRKLFNMFIFYVRCCIKISAKGGSDATSAAYVLSIVLVLILCTLYSSPLIFVKLSHHKVPNPTCYIALKGQVLEYPSKNSFLKYVCLIVPSIMGRYVLHK